MSPRFIHDLGTVTYGIRDGRSINVEEYMDTLQTYPSFEEQKLIGLTLDCLDSLITLHQRKQENVWHQNGAWNGLTNPLVFRTPLAASSPSCTSTVARMDAADGADRVAAGSVPMARTFVCAPGDASAAEPSPNVLSLCGGCPAPLGVTDLSRDAMLRRLNVRISDGGLEALGRDSAEMGCSRSRMVRLLVHCLADGGTRMTAGTVAFDYETSPGIVRNLRSRGTLYNQSVAAPNAIAKVVRESPGEVTAEDVREVPQSSSARCE